MQMTIAEKPASETTLAPARGFEYNRELGRWWHTQAANRAHSNAYRNVADYLRASFPRDPGLIVDYACGAGNLLVRLTARFPQSKLIGLDGSVLLLDHARQRLARMENVTLIETGLPNYHLLRGCADLLVFCFPNMVPSRPEDDSLANDSLLSANDRAVARNLAAAPDAREEDESRDPEDIHFSLLQARLVSLNLRGLLKKGGFCARVEYGRVRRDELSPLDLTRVSFEEGSLEGPVCGRRPGQWFRVVASSCFRSQVVRDVYQQTAEETDRKGGYLITVLRAL